MNVIADFVNDWINPVERKYLTLFFDFFIIITIILEGDCVTSSSQFALTAAVEILKWKYLFFIL